MSFIAGSILIAAGVGAAATAYAASQSSNAITSSTNAAINAQETAQQRQQQILAPYAGIGSGGAIQQYQNLLGIGPPGSPSPQATLAATPGYQFAKTEGSTGVLNAASAMGLTLSGNTLEGLDKFTTGLADQTYQEAVANAGNAVSIGENAAAGTGAGILATGQGVSGALLAQGNTIAGIDANLAAGLTKVGGNAANQLITSNTLAGLNSGSGLPGGSYYTDLEAATPGSIGSDTWQVPPIPGVTGP